MSSKTVTWLAVFFIICLLSCNFVLCGFLSYWGTGIAQMSSHSLRTGSVSGPIIGGGPNSGK